MAENSLSPPQAIYRLASGFIPARALYVAAKLRIADLLGDGPKSIDALASAAKAEARALFSVLHALAHFGVFEEGHDMTFALTPVGELLRSDTDDSLRPLVIMYHEEMYGAFAGTMQSVRTGRPSFNEVFGKPLFEYAAADPAFESLFHRAMNSVQRIQNPALVDTYDFAEHRCVVDVGGGNGALLSSILERYRHLRGILFDRAPAIAAARSRLEGVVSRCELVAGDFFECVPKGGDLYVLKLVVHDWLDNDAIAILRNCRAAMADGSRLLVIERLVGAPDEPLHTRIAALIMLHVTGGIERTEAEFRALLQVSGFRLERVTGTPSDLFLLDCRPA